MWRVAGLRLRRRLAIGLIWAAVSSLNKLNMVFPHALEEQHSTCVGRRCSHLDLDVQLRSPLLRLDHCFNHPPVAGARNKAMLTFGCNLRGSVATSAVCMKALANQASRITAERHLQTKRPGSPLAGRFRPLPQPSAHPQPPTHPAPSF